MASTPTDFKTQLQAAVTEFEQQTDAELVVAIAPRAGIYPSPAWLAGMALAVVALTIFIYHPFEFFDDEIYAGSILAFIVGYCAVRFVPMLQRLLSRRAHLREQSELNAYALFSRQGLHHTSRETAVLVYLPRLEQEAVLVADRGVRRVFEPQELAEIEAKFRATWSAADPRAALLACIRELAPRFAKAMPAHAQNDDELGNALDLDKNNAPKILHGGFGAKSFRVR